MGKDDWQRAARARGGSIVVWIEQSTDPNLKRVNSNGVCHALTIDWIQNYMQYREDRSTFVNAFRENHGLRPDGTSIPSDYIEQQGLYQSQVQGYNAALQSVKAMKQALSEQGTLGMMVQGLKSQRQGLYGENAVVVQQGGGKSVTEIVNAFPSHPCYVALSFRRNGGHVVGFEFRPDVHVTENYPQLFEYFDANLGLFVFPTRSALLAFFLEDVWATLYRNAYAGCTFQTATYGVALGVGFGADAELEGQLEDAPQGVDIDGSTIRRVKIGNDWKTIGQIHDVVLGSADEIAKDGVDELTLQRDFPSALFPELVLHRVQPVQRNSNVKLLAALLLKLASPASATRITPGKRVEFIRYIHHIASQIYFNRAYRDPWVWSVAD